MGSEANLRAYNPVPSVEVTSVEVHGAALAARAAGAAAGQLGQHAHEADTHEVRPTVAAVRRDHGVRRTHRRSHAHRHGFLPWNTQ